MARFNQPNQQFNGDQYNAENIHFHQPPNSTWKRLRLIVAILILLGIVLLAVIAILWIYVPSRVVNSCVQTATPAMTTANGPIYTVKNTSETLPDGVYFQHSLQADPACPTPTPTYKFGVFKNERVRVSCWASGDAVYGDQVWYYVYNVTRPFIAGGRSNKGWLSAHYVNDGMTANHVAPGVPRCSSPLPIGG